LDTLLLIGYLIKNIVNFIDDMPTNDTYVSNIEHNNDGSIDIPDSSHKLNLNPLPEECLYLGQCGDLIINDVQGNIYNNGTSEYLLHLVKNLR
jgi:hypothetical protein